jgi:hypothetical protein
MPSLSQLKEKVNQQRQKKPFSESFSLLCLVLKAIFALEEAVRLDPISSFLRVDLAELYLNQSRFTDAYHEATSAVSEDGSEDTFAHSRRFCFVCFVIVLF